jgi:hypothetical protein
MSETLDHSRITSQDILHLAAMSLSAAPGLTEVERTARSHAVIQGAMEFQPADPAQTVLASLILGHHLVIMDGFRDIACLTLTPAEAARARMVTVAQTKLVLQMLREMRIERKETLTRAAAEAGEAISGPAPEPAPGPPGDAAFEVPLAKFLSAYTETLSALEDAGTLTPAVAARARKVLGQAMHSAPVATPGQENSVSGEVAGSRAQRRAMMKRSGAFKRTA